MSTPTAAPAETTAEAPAQRQLVLAVAISMVVLQTGFRAWASAGSWWYADDLELLSDARRSQFSLDYLLRPHDSQLMPFGRFLAWTASGASELAWWPGALQLVVLQLAAGLAAVWMLVRVFGARPGVLGPLALYLFSPLTLTAYLWWAAAVNQLPLHLAFFLAVGCHVTYVRTGYTRWAVLAALAVSLGMTAYVKAALVLPVLLLLSLGPFAAGGASMRLRVVLGQWRGFALYALLGATYAAAYVTWVPSPVADGEPTEWIELARVLVLNSLGPTAIGGPWTWDDRNPPVLLASSKPALVFLSWIAIIAGLVAAHLWNGRRRNRTSPIAAVVLATGWVTSAYVLVGLGRAPQLGVIVGLELRYLADSAMVLALALGLWMMPILREQREQSAGGDSRAPSSWPVLPTVLVAAVLLAGCVWSNVTYVAAWHGDYAVRSFVRTAAESAGNDPRIIADTPVPSEVMGAAAFPDNLPSRLLGGLSVVRAVEQGTDLEILDETGLPRPGTVRPDAGTPPGPEDGCGYRVGPQPVDLPMEGGSGYLWWLSVSYLASGDGELTIRMGERDEEVQVLKGLHTLFLRGEGGWRPLELRGSRDVIVCVDAVRVGDLVVVEDAS